MTHEHALAPLNSSVSSRLETGSSNSSMSSSNSCLVQQSSTGQQQLACTQTAAVTYPAELLSSNSEVVPEVGSHIPAWRQSILLEHPDAQGTQFDNESNFSLPDCGQQFSKKDKDSSIKQRPAHVGLSLAVNIAHADTQPSIKKENAVLECEIGFVRDTGKNNSGSRLIAGPERDGAGNQVGDCCMSHTDFSCNQISQEYNQKDNSIADRLHVSAESVALAAPSVSNEDNGTIDSCSTKCKSVCLLGHAVGLSGVLSKQGNDQVDPRHLPGTVSASTDCATVQGVGAGSVIAVVTADLAWMAS